MTFDRMVGIERRWPDASTWTRVVRSVLSKDAPCRVETLARDVPRGTLFRVRASFVPAERALLYVVVSPSEVVQVSSLATALVLYESGRLGAVVGTWNALNLIDKAAAALRVAAALMGQEPLEVSLITWDEIRLHLAQLEVALPRSERGRLGAVLRDLVPFYQIALWAAEGGRLP